MQKLKKITNEIYEEDLCFVPTMGSLHEGHFSLIEIAKESGLKTIVSIFVNPKQFNDSNDYKQYPTSLDDDTFNLKKLNVDYLFTPSESYIYGDNFQDIIKSGDIGEQFEGRSRPGHFDGVLTVVNRLFELVKPKKAIFGKKDAQQLFLVKEYIKSSNKNIEILEGGIIRNEHGLALSSRNLLLTNEGRVAATALKKKLDITKKMYLETGNIEASIRQTLNDHKDAALELDYLQILDKDTFRIVDNNTKRIIIIIAGYVEGIRLIDNIDFGTEG